MRWQNKLIWSFIIAIGFLLLSYCMSNLNFPISGEKDFLYRFELVKNYFFPKQESFNDSILLIDVSFDKVPVQAIDEYGMPAGNIQITDRKKLLELLRELKRKNDYKYILLDVFFGEKGSTPYDSALYATISSMQRIVIPCHSDEALADSSLIKKAGWADYTSTYNVSGFAKYSYMTNDCVSLPLKMYHDVTGRTIRRHGFLFTDGWWLARKSIVLTFDINANTSYSDEGEKIWYYLGADILGNEKENGLLYESPELTKEKYIAIGASQGDDIHNTYIGPVSGTLINLNAYFSLLHHHHVVSITLIIILFCSFFILAFLTLTRQDLRELTDSATQKTSYRWRTRLLALSALCSWVGYSLFLTILCLFTYVFLGEVYEIFITATMFYLLALAIKYTDNFKKLSKIWKRRY